MSQDECLHRDDSFLFLLWKKWKQLIRFLFIFLFENRYSSLCFASQRFWKTQEYNFEIENNFSDKFTNDADNGERNMTTRRRNKKRWLKCRNRILWPAFSEGGVELSQRLRDFFAVPEVRLSCWYCYAVASPIRFLYFDESYLTASFNITVFWITWFIYLTGCQLNCQFWKLCF